MDGMKKVCTKNGTNHDPKHNTSSVNHGDMGMYSRQRNCSLVFTDDVTADSRMNFEVYRSIIAARMQPITERVVHYLAMTASGEGQLLSVTKMECHPEKGQVTERTSSEIF